MIVEDRLTCFKSYDVRGRVPEELNPDVAYRVGRAVVEFLHPRKVVVGRDIRSSSLELSEAFKNGVIDGGADILDIGLCGTEMVYFATSFLDAQCGVMITASHNPPEYNGMKFVREQSRPISGDSGLFEIERLAVQNSFSPSPQKGTQQSVNIMDDYVQYILKQIRVEKLKPVKIVSNPGNGGAGLVIDQLQKFLPFEIVKVHHEPDSTFPHGIPNPLLPENRFSTSEAVIRSHAAIGIAWDGDFDRCFLFDETGQFIEGYYIVGLLAQAMLDRENGARIIHDPRLTWNTVEMVSQNGGIPVQSKTGHAFIKEKMRSENAIYGGEMSAHHYFRDFFYCDSGMLPWLLVLEIMSQSGKPLSELIADRMKRFPCSGEINRRLKDPDAAIRTIRNAYEKYRPTIDETDGISFAFDQWRFNLRKSNTEPILRLNVETRQNPDLLQEKTDEILAVIDAM